MIHEPYPRRAVEETTPAGSRSGNSPHVPDGRLDVNPISLDRQGIHPKLISAMSAMSGHGENPRRIGIFWTRLARGYIAASWMISDANRS